jgi:hypothetical protein
VVDLLAMPHAPPRQSGPACGGPHRPGAGRDRHVLPDLTSQARSSCTFSWAPLSWALQCHSRDSGRRFAGSSCPSRALS